MKLHNVILYNIGVYYGEHSFFLDHTPNKKNIILIGGKNGSGKTTLLESIKLALFGSLSYGFRSETEGYKEKILSLWNRKAKINGQNTCKISVTILQVEDYKKNVFQITRVWDLKENRFKENLYVYKNNNLLSTLEAENFQNKLKEEIPPRLFELTLFDGEEIHKLINHGHLNSYLKEMSSILFNLDLFEKLETDLKDYKTILYTKKNLSDSEKKLKITSDQIEVIADKKIHLEKKYRALKNQLQRSEELLAEKKVQFHNLGGLHNEEKENLIEEEKKIEQKRQNNHEKIKKFISNELPFFLNKPLLSEVVKQMEHERKNEAISYLKELVDQSKVREALLDHFQDNQSLLVHELYEKMLVFIQKHIQEEKISLIHQPSSLQLSEVLHMQKALMQVKAKDYIQLYNDNQQLLKKSQEIRKLIELNNEALDLKELLNEIEETTIFTEQLRIEIETVNKEIKIVNEKIEKLLKEKNRYKERMKVEKKSSSTVYLSEQIMEISKKFRRIQFQKKLKQVEIEAIKMVNSLFRKKPFINEIQIDPDTFEVELYDQDLMRIKIDHLSSGEKELLILCLIWAVFRVSGRKLPFVFDTLFGRLDFEHRHALIKKLLPEMGEQIIILSTNTEIDEHLYTLLFPYIAREYTLEYHHSKNSTKIIPDQYFSLTKTEMRT
ncbi:DNA sulfur modification protein DndD [Thermoactinomyces mirandus]|uniref:Nuclease SbcCD subunit C n=1 Tax=Thermoactinomyces mirandus TaxID=2756294 RepID=A0A7W2ART8_9BACL|nr:DNA sulfur modification protein DndD [Thermoactinomyces mirandus]MBA4603334.1 DNA sulfur modification protein DndD [Thermoactinomyces mirandus]